MDFSNRIIFDSNIDSLPKIIREKNVIALIDSNVDKLYGNHFPFVKITINASETSKCFAEVESIICQLLATGAGKDCFLLGIGGGIVTDITGFVASIYKRGVRFGLIPTTLLAQADAAIGGKNGVNANGVKNAVGCLNVPDFVFICNLFLDSLPYKEYLNGVFEMLKIFLIYRTEDYKHTLALAKDRRRMDIDLIKSAVDLKCRVVDADFNDKGDRKILNLGHTFGHALESNSEWKLSHGAAVAAGIILATDLGIRLGISSPAFKQQLSDDFASIGLVIPEGIDVPSLIDFIKNDKKAEGNNICFIIPEAMGTVRTFFLSTNQLKELYNG